MIPGRTYEYPDVPGDVYRRHKNCTCTVDYDPGDGKMQDIWSKKWRDDPEVLEERKAIGLAETSKEELERRKTVGNNAELTRRKIGTNGKEIIDKPTYNKLTRDFIRRGGLIIRGKEAEKHLKNVDASASYIVGADIAFILDEATISDVLEEMHHAKQDREHLFGERVDKRVELLREIDAKKYLQRVAKKYKIPLAEQEETQKLLEIYESKLKEIKED